MKNKILVILFLALLISPFKLEAKADSCGCCKTSESNENSSSKIEEVPEGRRSMITQNMLLIRRIRQGWCAHTPPCPPSILEGELRHLSNYETPSSYLLLV